TEARFREQEGAHRLMAASIDAASRVITAFAPVGAKQDPVDALLEIPLDIDLKDLLSPPLEKLGFRIEDEQISDRFGTSTRTVSVARNQEQSFYIIVVPSWILEQALNANLAAFGYLRYIFVKSSHVYILARKLAAMELAFSFMIDEWSERDIK